MSTARAKVPCERAMDAARTARGATSVERGQRVVAEMVGWTEAVVATECMSDGGDAAAMVVRTSYGVAGLEVCLHCRRMEEGL